MSKDKRTGWRRRCSSDVNCVEVAVGADDVLVRDTKDQESVLRFDHGAWQRFVNWMTP